MLHHQLKKVQSFIPRYFKLKSTPFIYCNYTWTIAPKLFNYQKKKNRMSRHGAYEGSSQRCFVLFHHSTTVPGHVITGDVNIVLRLWHHDVKSLILKGLKFREARSFNFLFCRWIRQTIGYPRKRRPWHVVRME